MIQNSIDHHLGSIKPVVSTGISCLLTGAGLLSTVISLQSKVTIMYTHIYMCNVWTNHEVENESLTKDRFYWPGGGRECSCTQKKYNMKYSNVQIWMINTYKITFTFTHMLINDTVYTHAKTNIFHRFLPDLTLWTFALGGYLNQQLAVDMFDPAVWEIV